MKLHLVGGFLGSGKTTAILGAARYLTAQGFRVGVVTNDQGKYLVDTNFFRLADIATQEVTGGCFCCNYNDLEARIEQLQATVQPDVIFAKSVGSCADIVATIVKPLAHLRGGQLSPASFSVFVDSRLLRQRLLGKALPFSDDIAYIFDKQIEEAGLLVMNKSDLLSQAELDETEAFARQQFPGKLIRIQNSLEASSVADWVDLLDSGDVPLPSESLDIDYNRYGAGEAQLSWLDEEITLMPPVGQEREAVIGLIGGILEGVRHQRLAVGHLKFLIRGRNHDAKISFTTLDEQNWQDHLPTLSSDAVEVLVNARVESSAENLRALVQQALDQSTRSSNVTWHEAEIAFFHPGFPRPTHRMK